MPLSSAEAGCDPQRLELLLKVPRRCCSSRKNTSTHRTSHVGKRGGGERPGGQRRGTFGRPGRAEATLFLMPATTWDRVFQSILGHGARAFAHPIACKHVSIVGFMGLIVREADPPQEGAPRETFLLIYRWPLKVAIWAERLPDRHDAGQLSPDWPALRKLQHPYVIM